MKYEIELMLMNYEALSCSGGELRALPLGIGIAESKKTLMRLWAPRIGGKMALRRSSLTSA